MRAKLAVAVGAVLLAAHLVVLVVWVPQHLTSEAHRRASLPSAYAALDRNSLAEAKRQASILADSETLSPTERGGPWYVLGAVAAAEAPRLTEPDRTKHYARAAQWLEESHVRGFPAGREPEGLYLLGESLCRSNQFAASLPVLEEALAAAPQHSTELFGLLARALASITPADLSKARQYCNRYLADGALVDEDRFAGLLLSAQIDDRLGNAAASQASLVQIPATSASSPEALLLEATLLMRAARATKTAAESTDAERDEAQAKYQQAAEKLRLAQSRGSATEALALRAMYLVGKCLLESDNDRAALEQFSRVRERSPRTVEGVAAALEEAELLRRVDRHEEAIGMYRIAVRTIGSTVNYENELLSLETIRQRMSAAFEQYLRAGQFDLALQMARSIYPVFPRERELELSAEVLRAAARAQTLKMESAPADEAKIFAASARNNLRLAAQTYSKLAELRTTSRAYPDDLWNAAECFVEGRDFQNAAKLLELYLKNELRRRRARALLILGEAHMAISNPDKALEALQECIDDYPHDPASYQARLLVAKAHLEKGESSKAELLLRANLESGYLTPRSTEWRDSLFALGWLLEVEGRYQDAIGRLEEAVERYPDAPQAIEARYLIAESYRRFAQQAREKFEADTIETSRIGHAKQLQQYLTSAIEQYEQVQTILTRREQQREPNLLEQAILRNCYFARGAALCDLGRYEDAIRMYSTATNLYRGEPEVLEAFLQIANCYRRLNRPDEARGVLAQAKAALARIDTAADFTQTTTYTRDEWGQVLDQMISL